MRMHSRNKPLIPSSGNSQVSPIIKIAPTICTIAVELFAGMPTCIHLSNNYPVATADYCPLNFILLLIWECTARLISVSFMSNMTARSQHKLNQNKLNQECSSFPYISLRACARVSNQYY